MGLRELPQIRIGFRPFAATLRPCGGLLAVPESVRLPPPTGLFPPSRDPPRRSRGGVFEHPAESGGDDPERTTECHSATGNGRRTP